METLTIFMLDKYMFALIDGSGFVILIMLGILRILAKHTNFAPGNEIIEMLLGVFRKVKMPGRKIEEKSI